MFIRARNFVLIAQYWMVPRTDLIVFTKIQSFRQNRIEINVY